MAEAIALPPLQAILDLHRQSIERFGGSHGLRDSGAVEAALARAEQLLAYGGPDVGIHAVAAAVGYSLAKIRHPFVDGNNRVAWFTMFVILRLNGFYLDAREVDATAVVLGVADGSVDEISLVTFLQANSWRVRA
ncbi:type II toxin-antitoxin system death-on-curing family toxin [Sandaracinobacteroides saxicola]|uniref:Type II toxin-antitoxin system death-on-curing family toxin n=1 Tax=Sandaracinobacteroides saxicola TaxID=2759707 RepID=A0A7G5IHZ3_9SPHN|nr:type II toxin-antitoxin system death-on-curing family toxin [Sandaracinobacteroides saxicola]QMW22985.1 type II toxin-antitoxin system death-on-curing family toxin [Sandaracinobacteroides saxicola]